MLWTQQPFLPLLVLCTPLPLLICIQLGLSQDSLRRLGEDAG